MSQGSNFSRIGMTNTRQKFDDSNWERGFNKGGKKKTEKQNQHKQARRDGNRQRQEDSYGYGD